MDKTQQEIGIHLEQRQYYLQLLVSEIMKLFGSTKSKINNKENGKNVPHSEFT